MPDSPAPAVVAAARAGDERAMEHVLAFALPLVYNIVGRALRRHSDVDDVVQETMLRVVRGLPELKDDTAFRSWLAAITIRQVRDNERERVRAESRRTADGGWTEPADRDFAGESVLRLGLTAQRRDVAEATRWLDDDERELLSLWWLEESGQIDRAGLAGALGLSAPHAAVRVHRMKKQLDTSRAVVQALRNDCHAFRGAARQWDGIPSPLWRKRFARHIRDCKLCTPRSERLLPLATLLTSLPLVPPPFPVPHYIAPSHAGAHAGAAAGKAASHAAIGVAGSHSMALPIAAATAAVVAIAGGVTLLHPFGGASTAAASQPPTIAATSTPGSPPGSSALTPSSSPSTTTAKAAVPSPTTPRPTTLTVSDARKGVCVWNAPSDSRALAASGASWYYTWSTNHNGVTTPANASFVPMIWGAKSVTAQALAEAKGNGDHLLGFNEPDMGAQSNMTPQQALNLWPQLMATGMVLGSPAVAYGGDTPNGWLDQFMLGAASRGYRVDFIALHWYGGDFRTPNAVAELKSYLDAVYARYHKPIWLTEYALTDFANGQVRYPTADQQAAFVTASTKMLAGLPYLQRYAWFGLEANTAQVNTALFDESGAATTSGKAFETAP